MTESMLQQQLDEVRMLAQRARELFGDNLIEPPALEVRTQPVTD